MNVMVITTFYPQPDRSDLLRDTAAIHYITREWVKQGHDVTVLHCYGHYFRELIREPGKHDFRRFAKVQECPQNEGVRVLLIENQYWIRNAKWYLPAQQKRTAAAINRYFKENMPEYQPDILLVHFPTHYIGIIERLDFSCRKAAVFHKTDVGTILQKPQAKRKLTNIYDVMGARSVQLQKKLEKQGVHTTFLAQSGIDEAMLLSDAAFQEKWESRKDRKNQTWKIAYAGNIVKDKHAETIVRALGRLRGKAAFSFTAIGDGACLELCARTAEELQIADRCQFIGRQSREETVAQMKEADIFVMVSEKETLGLVYLEAMSQGCLTIGSKGEGIDGILVDETNGYLVPAGDAEALAARLLAIMERAPEENRRTAYAGLQTIRQMTSRKTAENYLKCVLGNEF